MLVIVRNVYFSWYCYFEVNYRAIHDVSILFLTARESLVTEHVAMVQNTANILPQEIYYHY